MRTDITELLIAHGGGDAAALNRLVPLVYDDLRRLARVQLRRRRPGDTLDTNGLVHEAYLRLVDQSRASWRDRGHFFAVSALAMLAHPGPRQARLLDALIVGAAQVGGCRHVLTEDLQDGQEIAGVRVVDPFRSLPDSLI